MEFLRTVPVQCACCGETIDVLVDCTVPEQEYVEDCQVCCQPLVLTVYVDGEGSPSVSVRPEND